MSRGYASLTSSIQHTVLADRRYLIDSMYFTDVLEALYRAGFTTVEIMRLAELRRTYLTGELDQAPEDLARLRFARWLVANGRLSDQLA